MNLLARTAGFAVVACVLGGCTVGDPGSPNDTSTDSTDLTSSSFTMPKAIIGYENQMGWGTHHLRWHTERQWNLLNPSDKAWAVKQGWSAATIQEGRPGNGLEFLAMHRVMIGLLVKQYPQYKALFTGWTVIPTKPNDPTAPKTSETFTPDMLNAVDKLQNHIGDFATDDDFGVYLETELRPTSSNPDARSTDPSTGIHNFIHNRFADSSSPIDLGDPSKNLGNKVFWRLHGWIDARWTAFRVAKGLSDSDPAYVAALANANSEMMKDMPKDGGPLGQDNTPPESLTKFFEQEGL
jgi:hypothetical protein